MTLLEQIKFKMFIYKVGISNEYIKNINDMGKNMKDFLKRVDVKFVFFDSFPWAHSRQGFKFWREVNHRWCDYVDGYMDIGSVISYLKKNLSNYICQTY